MRRKPTLQTPGKPRESRFEGSVRDLTSRGLGVVAHPDGRVFFVPGVWAGESGIFEVVKHKGRGGEARLITLNNASAERIQAPCPHHGFDAVSCGGCPWMFMSYAQQVEAKQARVEQALTALNCETLATPLLESDLKLGYRNRAQLKTDGRQLGFVTPSAAKIAPVDDCLILSDHNRKTLRHLRTQLPNQEWRPARGKNWTTLEFDDQLVATAVTPNLKRPFMQGNSAQNQRMRHWLYSMLESLAGTLSGTLSGTPSRSAPETAADEDSGNTLLLELFAGSGNFTEIAAAAGFSSIVAVDSFAPAIDALSARGILGVTAQQHDLYASKIGTSLSPALAAADVLLLDPPREGFKGLGQCIEVASKLRWIIYISCDLATFTRDVRSAMERGFELQSAQGLDLFPQTPHVEIMSVMKRNPDSQANSA
ncbi:MAG: class I SAM-dependent RNA methyltransferase [Congregibacter sp.]